jgi:hypothetical protein
VRVGTALPVRDAKRVTRLLCDKIETIEPGFGIEIMTLAATVAEPLAAKQTVNTLVDEPEPDVSSLIDLLANRRVKRADGPERVFGEWWKRDPELIAIRDYFRIEDDAGERYWIFRAGDGEDPETGSHRWFLHGIFG